MAAVEAAAVVACLAAAVAAACLAAVVVVACLAAAVVAGLVAVAVVVAGALGAVVVACLAAEALRAVVAASPVEARAVDPAAAEDSPRARQSAAPGPVVSPVSAAPVPAELPDWAVGRPSVSKVSVTVRVWVVNPESAIGRASEVDPCAGASAHRASVLDPAQELGGHPGGGTPGYGYGGRGAYGAYHAGWANGYWHGNVNNWGWGAVAALTPWGLGTGLHNWGYSSYTNPYYYAAAEPIVYQQTLATGEDQTVSVQPTNYDYSQPLDPQSPPPAENVANPAIARFDEARAAFGTGDYATALKLNDEALKSLPNDATLHEFRAPIFFAIGKYDLAAGPLYAVLSVGPGWDWTTLSSLYPDIEVYTAQLRKLEAFVKANPRSADGQLRTGLSLPDSRQHRRRRGPAQASRRPRPERHALSPTSPPILARWHPGGGHRSCPNRAGNASLEPGQTERLLDRAVPMTTRRSN